MTDYVDLLKIPPGARPSWSVRQAVAFAVGEVTHPHEWYHDLCDHFQALCYGYTASGEVSASSHWRDIPGDQKFGPGIDPPVGALAFWDIGVYGHVAGLVTGNNHIATSDAKRDGRIDIVPLAYIHDVWNATYLGWARPYFANAAGVNPWPPTNLAPLPSVNLDKVRNAARNDPHDQHPHGTAIVQRGLEDEGLLNGAASGRFGGRTRNAYARWQHRCGVRTTGIPDGLSLRRLGRRHAFAVN